MDSFISVSNPIDKNRLKSSDYFRTLAGEGADKGILSEFDFENIQCDLVELLGNICLGISEKGHGSMKTEVAEKIAASIMYTISVALKKSPTPESALERLKRESLEALFYEGQQDVVALLTKARGILAVINKELFETPNYYYNNILVEGIKEFFRNYEYTTCAHIDKTDLDYPVYIGGTDEVGVEKICSYLSAFREENRFLNKFPAQNVHGLMMNLDREMKGNGVPVDKGVYIELPVNLFSYILAAALVLEYYGKDIFSLYVTRQDAEGFSADLEGKSYSELVTLFDSLSEKISLEINAEEALKDYLKKAVRILASDVSSKENAMLTGMLMYHYEEDETFVVNETERLSDSEYRRVVSQLEACNDEEERIKIIKGKINCYEDFIDIVNDLSLDAHQILLCLPYFDMAENLKLFRRYNLFSFCFNEEDNRMKNILERYVNSLDVSTKKLIIKMLSVMQ